MTDPFAHHPELRERITSCETSFFRDFRVEELVRQHPEMEPLLGFAHTDELRETMREASLEGHHGDLWIFAYGSLMWDPAMRFEEVRRCHAPGRARRFILKDEMGARGTAEAPGLMAALDTGDGCEGLAYRIAEKDIATETEILFRRELVGPAYVPAFIPVQLSDGSISALTFLANHDYPLTISDLSWQDQVQIIATGTGLLGSSRDYLASVVSQLSHLGIEDEMCSSLLREVDRWIANQPKQEATL